MRQRQTAHQSKNENQKARPPQARALPQPGLQMMPTTLTAQSILRLQRTIGNRATRDLIQRQDPEGSSTVVGSTGASEVAADQGSFSEELAEEEGNDLEGSLEERAGKAHFSSQHPSLAQLGIKPKEIKGNKLALYVGNSNYKNTPPWDDLPGAQEDTSQMQAAMQGHGYKTLATFTNMKSGGISTIFRTGITKAKAGDALLLYYAGHGVPEGLAGIDSDYKEDKKTKEEEGGEGGGDRGIKLVKDVELPAPEYPDLTDIASYAKVVQILESGVAKGVHTTLIADACHSGAAADLLRDKAIDKVGTGENKEIGAVKTQIKRLEDMKSQIPGSGGSASGEGSRGFKLVKNEDSGGESSKETYWKKIVKPELTEAAAYATGGGVKAEVPDKLSDYTSASIEQQINQIINKLIDLAELLKKEEAESAVDKAPG
jgi:hypothetical protein